ncbi:Phasin [Phaeovulum vinaykumarii]|uniref:Phasin protein n=1 Tax=Phaeovulum vinaykumarii TaxID=407234 RepID=A0A1N7JY72_9RHOB|nr:Phasin [Phaeovulum vinaykumarii]SIS54293.1 hypothetical protein SAMN05421795_101443 [Phaeovulum vinaykumarii]SOB91883.1 hypothetical protein SAMN05878426_101441 [Phaeovulum vinaykumarii]
MAKNQDFTKMMKDMMSAFPMDMTAMQDAMKTQMALSEKMAQMTLEAAEKSTEISAAWTKATLVKMGDLTKSQEDPADYAKALTDFASANAEMTAENLAAFAEVAKKLQMETVELMLSTGKDMAEETTAAVKKATSEVTSAAKKVTTAAAK